MTISPPVPCFRPWSVRGRHTMLLDGSREPISNRVFRPEGRSPAVTRLHRNPRPGDGTSGAGSRDPGPKAFCCCYAAASSLLKRKSVPSTHMRCSTVASLRASATLARIIPRRLATFTAHRLRVEKPLNPGEHHLGRLVEGATHHGVAGLGDGAGDV